MNLKNKVLTCFFVVFLLNLLLIGVYYRVALSYNVTEAIDIVQEKLDSKALYAAELIKEYGNKKFSEIIQSDSELVQNDVVIVDINSNSIIFGKEKSEGKVSFYGTAITEHNGRKLLIKVYKYIDIKTFRTFAILKRLLFTEGVIVTVFIVLLGFIFHYIYVKPLLHINHKMSLYRKRKKIDFADVKRKDELGQIEKEFYQLVNTIEEERQLQMRIIASISHDVKTPLTSVLGYVERLRNGKISDGEKVNKYLQIIHSRAQDIKDIIGEFDEYLSSNSDESPMNMRKVSSEYLCNLLEEEYSEELAFKGVEFKVENICKGCSVNIDILKIRRVFANTIGNALRYVHIPGKIKICCEKAGDKIRFVISDNGTGVPEEELDKIFEAFYTRDSSRGTGSGLGLSICKRIVEAHQGAIYSRGSEWGGLDIVIELPADAGKL